MSDDALINKLRFELAKAAAIYSSPETHVLMARKLGKVWDDAVQLYGTKQEAAKFILTPVGFFKGISPFDVILSGDEGKKRYEEFLETLHLQHA